jgi:hypothetical protein
MKLIDLLDSLIPHLTTLEKDENAEPFYELMSVAFIWSDEKVRGLNVNEMSCLGAILRYRTSLVVGDRDEKMCVTLELAQREMS